MRNRATFIFLLTMLLSLPGIIWCWTAFSEVPFIRKILWSCYITAFPVAISCLLAYISNRVVKIVLYVLAILLFLINSFLVLNFSTLLSPSIILLCMETSGRETSEFIESYLLSSSSIVAYAMTAVAILAVILTETGRLNLSICHSDSLTRSRFWKIAGRSILCIWIVVALIHTASMSYMFCCRSQESMAKWYNTIGLYDTGDTVSDLLFSVHHLNITKHENDKAIATNLKAQNIEATCSDDGELHVVVVIGESYNKYHSQLYGYSRQTTPSQATEQEAGHLFVFTDVVSPYNLTSLSVKNMLSTNSLSRNQNWADHPVFPVIFRRAGFQVNMWDNQKTEGNAPFHDFTLNSFLYDKEMKRLAYDGLNPDTYTYDMELTDHFLNEDCNRPHQLTIFHLTGQHSYATHRYPHTTSYQVFQTADGSSSQYDIDEYDNATLYNDAVISSIFDHYRQRCAVVVCLSDHGEEVYDYRPFMGRTQEKTKDALALKYQYEVPFTIWCSDSYAERYPSTVLSIAQSTCRPFTLDNLPHLLFTLAAVHTPFYDSEKDILSASYKVGRRIVQDTVDYDEVMNR